MKKIAFISFCLLVFIACKKKTAHFIIKGTVTDNSFSAPLTGVTAYLYKVSASTSQEELITSTELSSSGEYSFDIERDKSTSFVVRIDKTNYFPIEKMINFSDLSVEKDNVYNLSTTAKSWVNLHFRDLSPQSSSEVTYTKQQGKTDCAECCTKSEISINGIADTSIYCINDGNSVYSYLYFVTGTTNSGIKQITTVPFDTVELYLGY